MEPPITFYSWQSDSNKDLNKHFIGKCLESLAKRASVKLGLPEGLVIDRDTKGVPGSPIIVLTIFDKIDRSAVFVADVTFVGECFAKAGGQSPGSVAANQTEDRKRLPNPNVMIELGYAMSALGPDRLVLVMNTAFGPAKDLVFDLKNRRFPVEYHLDDKSDPTVVQAGLESELSKRILGALKSSHAGANRGLRRLNEDCLKLIEATKALQSFPDNVAASCGLGDFRATVNRLLDLELLFTDVNPNTKFYAYHWTYIGSMVRNAVLDSTNQHRP